MFYMSVDPKHPSVIFSVWKEQQTHFSFYGLENALDFEVKYTAHWRKNGVVHMASLSVCRMAE